MVFITDTFLKDIALLLITVLIFFVLYVKYKYTYWSKRNVPFLPPTFLLGNNSKQLFQKETIGQIFAEHYNKFDEQNVKYGGLYLIIKPILLINDPDIIKHLLTKEFNYFQNRAVFSDEKIDPLSGHLFASKIPKWRFLRTKLSPTFTSGKMKMMFPTLVECGHQLEYALEAPAKNGEPIDIKDILARFTTDVIGSCAFGLDCNSLQNPDAEFRKYGRMVFESSTKQVFQRALFFSMPKVFKFLKLTFISSEVSKFFMNVIKQTVDYREQANVERKDFMNLLIKLKNNENIDDEEEPNTHKTNTNEPNFTLNDIAAQSFVFFIAGFETSSSTMTFCLYELCINPDIQDKTRNEVLSILKKYNGQLTYEAIMEMHYMDKVVNETLRKYPIVPVLNRECTTDFKLPDSNLLIEKGTNIFIPVLGIHRNPKYYPDPMKFDPERLNDEEKSKRHPYTYLPFGEGPRNCIGKRFGLMQTKVGLAILLKNYKFTLDQKTNPNIRLDVKSFIMAVKGGVWLDATKIV